MSGVILGNDGDKVNMAKILEDIISGNFIDPETGKPFDVPIEYVIIESGISKYFPDYTNQMDLGKKSLVVADENTFDVLGCEIANCLKGKCRQEILPADIYANQEAVDRIRKLAVDVDYIVAVGSGAINDICKYASFLEGKPYIVFPTAPSMNGYSSANAAITVGGHKKSLAAHLPKAIFCDLAILAAAPVRLVRSGFGDSICRPTAQIDWYLSHCVLGTNYSDVPFVWLGEYEKDLFDNSEALVSGDIEIMKLLVETLIISGLGMYYCGGSYPASQGEHMIAHTIEMVFGNNLLKTYHGEQIGVATLTMARMQDDLIRRLDRINLEEVEYNADVERQIISFYGGEVGAQCAEQYKNKCNILHKNGMKDGSWQNKVREKYSLISVPVGVIEEKLKNCGACVKARDIGLRDEEYNDAVRHAKFARDRLTFLDFT